MADTKYKGIADAPMGNRYPFFQEPGQFVVRLVAWTVRDTRQHGAALFVDVEIVESSNAAAAPGDHRTFMRIFKRDGSLSDVKTLAHAALSAAQGEHLDSNTITEAVMEGLENTNGEAILGTLLGTENVMTKTKLGKDFTRVNWRQVTPAEAARVNAAA